MCNVCTEGKERWTRFENSIGRQISVQVLHTMDVLRVEKLDWRDSPRGLPRKARCANVQYCAVAIVAPRRQFYSELARKRVSSPKIAKTTINVLLSARCNQTATVDRLSTVRLFSAGEPAVVGL